MRCIKFALLALGLALAPVAASAAEFRKGDTVQTVGAIDNDLFVAGRTVGIGGPVNGDLFAAGWNVALVGAVAESAYLAGGEVTVDGPIAGDLISAALDLTVNAPIAGDATMTAGNVRIAPGAAIAGDLNVTGGEVLVESTVAGELRVAGGRVVLSGRVDGDVDVAAGELELRPGAQVGGTIRHRAPDQVVVQPGATAPADTKVEMVEDEALSGPSLLETLGEALAVFVLGAVIFLAFPRLVRDTAADVRERPVRNLLLGFVVIVCVPITAILFIVTIIGIPVGLMLLLLYLVAFPLGLAVAGFGLATMVRHTSGPPPFGASHQLRRFAFFVVLLTLVGLIPGVGELAVFLAMAVGMGALVGRLLDGRRAGPPDRSSRGFA